LEPVYHPMGATHPKFNRISYMDQPLYEKQLGIPINFEKKRLGDDILRASPSGTPWKYLGSKNIDKTKKILKNMNSKENMLYSKLVAEKPGDKRITRFINKFKSKKNNPNLQYEMSRLRDQRNKLKKSINIEGGADYGLLKNEKAVEQIVAKDVTGVHKFREKLPRALRSVYFKGGL